MTFWNRNRIWANSARRRTAGEATPVPGITSSLRSSVIPYRCISKVIMRIRKGLLVPLLSGTRDPLGGFKGHRSVRMREGLFAALMIPLGSSIKVIRSVRLAAVFVLFQSLSQASLVRDFNKTKIPQQNAAGLICGFWRRKRDSNPRFRVYRTTVFKTAALDRSAISPNWSYSLHLFSRRRSR